MVAVIAIACCVILPVVLAAALWLAGTLSQMKRPTVSKPTRPGSREMEETGHEGM